MNYWARQYNNLHKLAQSEKLLKQSSEREKML